MFWNAILCNTFWEGNNRNQLQNSKMWHVTWNEIVSYGWRELQKSTGRVWAQWPGRSELKQTSKLKERWKSCALNFLSFPKLSSILQVRRLRLREVKSLTWGRRANDWQSCIKQLKNGISSQEVVEQRQEWCSTSSNYCICIILF